MTQEKLHIKNVWIIDPYQNKEGKGDVYIENGLVKNCIFEQETKPAAEFRDARVIDATDRILMPSIVDSNVHLREPGFERKATIKSELNAAVSAGVGHVICVPTCKPTIDSPALAQSIIEKAKDLRLSKVYPLGALTSELKGTHLSEMKSLVQAGCIALTNYYKPYENLNVLIRCYEYAATFDIPVFIYPQMPSLYRSGGVHDGYWSAKLGLPAIPESAETIAIATHLLLIEQTGVRAHFSQLSCAKSVKQIAQAKQEGLKISADVAAHQLFLNDSYLNGYDSNFHVCPPLRSQQDCDALIEGLKTGVIDSLCSSHQPHELAAKHLPFEASEPGISAIETLLPLAGRLEEKGFSIMEIARCLSANAAHNLGVPQEGVVRNSLADFCIIDRNSSWIFEEKHLQSAGKNTPFIGDTFKWRADTTVINGNIVFQRQD